jgi:predicted nucleic acid-binding protein
VVVVIADAGLLIGLAKIQQLDLLKDLFSNLLITQAVADECLRCSSSDAVLIRQAIDAS